MREEAAEAVEALAAAVLPTRVEEATMRVVELGARAESAAAITGALTAQLRTEQPALLALVERVSRAGPLPLLLSFQAKSFLQAFHQLLRDAQTPAALREQMLAIVAAWETRAEADPAAFPSFAWYCRTMRAGGLDLDSAKPPSTTQLPPSPSTVQSLSMPAAQPPPPPASAAAFSERQAKLYRELRIAEQHVKYFEELRAWPRAEEAELQQLRDLLRMFDDRLARLAGRFEQPGETALKAFAESLHARVARALEKPPPRREPSIAELPASQTVESLSAASSQPQRSQTSGVLNAELLDLRLQPAAAPPESRQPVGVSDLRAPAPHDPFYYL